jgi:hypothetical protein
MLEKCGHSRRPASFRRWIEVDRQIRYHFKVKTFAILALLTLTPLSASAACSVYHLAGKMHCGSASDLEIILFSGSRNERKLRLKNPPQLYSKYCDVTVQFDAAMNSESADEAHPLDPLPTRVIPSRSGDDFRLEPEKASACK